MGYLEMRKKIELYISTWEASGYPYGIPDEAPPELESAGIVPSYRMICKAILKNDMACKTLGYEREHCQAYEYLKKEQLIRDGKIRIVAVQYGIFGGTYNECT